IDYILADDLLISYLYKFKLDNSLSSTNSDHQILISTCKFSFTISKARDKNRCKRRTYNYKVITKENCEEFSNQVKTNMIEYQVPTTTDTTKSLEQTWHKIDTCITKAALKHITNKKYIIKNFFHNFTPKAT
ncbi:12802_t:CDS:1, partial [Cetraspora pellucida]